MRGGQTPVQKYWHKLLGMIQVGAVQGEVCGAVWAGRCMVQLKLASQHHTSCIQNAQLPSFSVIPYH